MATCLRRWSGPKSKHACRLLRTAFHWYRPSSGRWWPTSVRSASSCRQAGRLDGATPNLGARSGVDSDRSDQHTPCIMGGDSSSTGIFVGYEPKGISPAAADLVPSIGILLLP